MSAGPLTLVDVRTPHEYAGLGHLPGARLLPVDRIASAPAVLPDGPILVCCEHGVRSARAAELLVRAGRGPVYDLANGMAGWNGPREFGAAPIDGPAGWVVDNADLLSPGMRVLDVAAGRGRHALLFAAAGWPVTALDRDAERMAALSAVAARLGWPVTTEVCDLEAGAIDLGDGAYDLVVVTNYLHRPLMPAIVRALVPGGLLVYETFTTAQAARGRPSNPAFLLEAGELPRLVASLAVERQREGDVDGRMVASVVARKLSVPESQ
ncbi:MAG: methyltransferase domain-containing protein [Acidobacteria bacterium]|nr:methyltransferase domain-containing protein [Acidobacteriota bacterium]